MRIFTLFVLTTFLLSCKKQPFENEYENSLSAWMNFKKETNNSYKYTQVWYSWTGHSSEIMVTVRDGKIVARSYKAIGPDMENGEVIKTYAEWSEDETTLNSHSESTGASLTLDEIYLKARNEWLNVSRDENEISFETKNNGMISSCGYVSKECADECFRGITIKEISKLI